MRLRYPLSLLLLMSSGFLQGCAAPLTPGAAASPAAPTSTQVLTAQTLPPASIRWAVESVTAQPDKAPRLSFIDAQHVGGHGGCNTFGGSLSLDGENLRIKDIASTRKYCEGPAMGIETQFFKDLDNARRGRIVNGRLELMDASGAVILRLVPLA